MENESRKYVPPISMATLPRQSRSALFIGKIAAAASKAFLDMDSLAKHLIIAGGSGAGKTTAAMIIAEECLMRDIAVLVLDVSKRWSNFKEKCSSENMLKAYRRFGMESPRSFAAGETEISGDGMDVGITDFIESGTLHFFDLRKLDQEQLNGFVCKSARELISARGKRTKRLRMLVIIDDAYKLSPRFGGNAIATLEEARSRLRDSGVALMLITHSLIDFARFGLGSVGTEIWFRTSQAEDFDRAKKRFGLEYAACLSNLRTGEGMVANIDFNYGRPWFVEFRPLYHKP
jgi:DNA helicase HerA-like ATPase